jgi:glycosyltransferase involved in cell wall biosynthesis
MTGLPTNMKSPMNNAKASDAGVSIIMPTYNQSPFISIAVNSVLNQSHKNWELIIINDGSRDDTDEVANQFSDNKQILYYRNSENLGLGKSLNIGIEYAKFKYIAYLPSDDLFFPEHLETLLNILKMYPSSILAFSGVLQANYNVMGSIETYHKRNFRAAELQLVQVMHKKNSFKWMEREECITDDYFKMYWDKLSAYGAFIPTNQVTCQWVGHPNQRHKKISSSNGGGLNIYRSWYKVKTPLIFKPKNSGLIDEVNLYNKFREKKPVCKDSLKILLVGELSFNPERIYALEESGHKLYGLWAKNCWWFHTIGPLAFGNVTEISEENWKKEIQVVKPDIIYGLLSALAAPFVAEVVKSFPDIPFVWHFKEGPFYARQNGLWDSVKYLFNRADGIIYINEDIRHFYSLCFPGIKNTNYLILDGELPKKDWFLDKRKPLLSKTVGGFHTVVPGRPLGITPEHIGRLAEKNVHFHFYGESWHYSYSNFVNASMALAPNHLHLHPNCDQQSWTEELSQYDAGWLHFFESKNHGNYLRTTWEDLNIPARMATLISAGLPLLQRDNTGHIVATQNICRQLDIGVFFKDIEELAIILGDHQFIQKIRENVWQHKMEFTFDFHIPALISFFREVIKNKAIV